MGGDRRSDRAGRPSVRSVLTRWDKRFLHPRCGRMLPADVAVLAAIFHRQHRGTDRRRLQRSAAAGVGRRRRRRGEIRRAARERVDVGGDDARLAGGFRVAQGRGSHRHALRSSERGGAGRRDHAVRRAGKARRRARRDSADRRCQRHRAADFSPSAATSRNSAIR